MILICLGCLGVVGSVLRLCRSGSRVCLGCVGVVHSVGSVRCHVGVDGCVLRLCRSCLVGGSHD